jgi:hypothetical protein
LSCARAAPGTASTEANTRNAAIRLHRIVWLLRQGSGSAADRRRGTPLD